MAENSSGGPEHGARLLVRLREGDGVASSASYSVVLSTASGEWEAEAVVQEADGRVETGPWQGGAPPPWLVQAAHALLRATWQRKRAGHPWPRRLARWRPSPEGNGP